MTLIILAAGMGSRYGGLKQIDPITDNGEFIIDFSIHDAIKSGFNKVVFVVKRENYEIFKETVGKRIEPFVKTEYVFQEISDVPQNYADLIPTGRTKPWGTAQAVLAARHSVDENFAVVNADDFYGRHSFELLANHLKHASTDPSGKQQCCMIGYRLENTLTENGTVSRGVCDTDADMMLKNVTERTQIAKTTYGAAYIDENGNSYPLKRDTLVSMNCWGFTHGMMDIMWREFEIFLGSVDFSDDSWTKKEFYLPTAVQMGLDCGKCSVKVYPTDSVWYGMTYKEDKESVRSSLRELAASGKYPQKLWETNV